MCLCGRLCVCLCGRVCVCLCVVCVCLCVGACVVCVGVYGIYGCVWCVCVCVFVINGHFQLPILYSLGDKHKEYGERMVE